MAKLYLGLGPRQGLRPVERAAIMVFIDKIQKRFPRRRDYGPKGDPRDLAGRNHQPLSECKDRIEHGANAV